MKIPEGWPTRAMIEAGLNTSANRDLATGATIVNYNTVANTLRAALAAAPTPPTPPTPPAQPCVDKKATGIHRKFNVERTDGSSEPGRKHHECEYFVLDMTHDPHALPAIAAYASSCKAEYPLLAADLKNICIQYRQRRRLSRRYWMYENKAFRTECREPDGVALKARIKRLDVTAPWVETALFRRPDTSELRKAAEEALAVLKNIYPNSVPVIKNLRTALNKQSTTTKEH